MGKDGVGDIDDGSLPGSIICGFAVITQVKAGCLELWAFLPNLTYLLLPLGEGHSHFSESTSADIRHDGEGV